MKIAIVIMQCNKSRSSRYVNEVCGYFSKDNDVHVFTHEHDDELEKKALIHKIPALTSNFYMREVSFMAFATAIMKTQKFDAAIAQPTRYFSPDVGYMQFVYREWANRMKDYGLRQTIGNKILAVIEKRNVKKAKKIITMSNVLKNEVLKNYNIPEEKIEVVYSGVNCAEFTPHNRKLYCGRIRKEFGISVDDIVLMFAGNPFERKGLEYLIKSLPMINGNVKILILGKDDITSYQDIARRLGVGGRIKYAGFTSEISKYFSAADIFVFPTLYEPFGLVIAEAMASGLPPVVSRCAGAAELIEDGKEGILLDNPKSPEEIAEKINYLVDNNLFWKMGMAARKKAETLTWEKTARQMLSVLEEAAEMHKKSFCA